MPFNLPPRQIAANLQLSPDEKYVFGSIAETAGARNTIIPNYVTAYFPEWFGTFFLLAMFAAAMSTLSGQFHAAGDVADAGAGNHGGVEGAFGDLDVADGAAGGEQGAVDGIGRRHARDAAGVGDEAAGDDAARDRGGGAIGGDQPDAAGADAAGGRGGR